MLCGFAPVEQSLALAEQNGWLELARHLKLTGLANTVRWALEEKNHKTPTNLPNHLRIVGELYANTGGVYVALLMNHITLKAGQAMFLQPGNVHSYLSGLAVEVMSSSDNVMRAAFTSKHVDLQEFFATAKIESHLPAQVTQRDSSTNTVDYEIQSAPFRVQKITVNSDMTIQANHEVELYLCVQGHSGALHQGQACILQQHEVLQLEKDSVVFRVWGN
jgi:mannose-6-phosphate isomerase